MDAIPFIAGKNGPPWLPSAAAEARKFAYWAQLVLLIFFIIGLIAGLLGVLALAAFGGAIWAIVYIIFAAVDILILWLLKTTVFQPLDQGRFKEASDRLIIWGILGIVLGGILPGLMLLIAWINLQEVFQVPYTQYRPQQYYQAPPSQQPQPQQRPPQQQPQEREQYTAPPPTAPAPSKTKDQRKTEMVKCANCGVQYPTFMRNCPNCGAPR